MKIINTTNINQARKEIQELKKQKKKVIIQAQDDEFNRKIFENKDIDIVIGLETHKRKDYMKQRDSGLNEILTKLAKENNIKIAIDISKIKNHTPKDKAIILSRIKQNIQLCKRTKTKLILIPKPNKQEAISLFLSLGASTSQAKQAIE
jgi:ribonuclease P/MRP protein subunit RPP1